METITTFRDYLAAKGPMSRRNPELLRLATKTGFSVEQLFRVALGDRACSSALAKAVVANSRKQLTEAAFPVAER